jgi:hypothetical protein
MGRRGLSEAVDGEQIPLATRTGINAFSLTGASCWSAPAEEGTLPSYKPYILLREAVRLSTHRMEIKPPIPLSSIENLKTHHCFQHT